MGHGDDHGVVIGAKFRGQVQAIFFMHFFFLRVGVFHVHFYIEGQQFLDRLDDAGVADIAYILFEGHAFHEHLRFIRDAQDMGDDLARDVARHVVVDVPGGGDDFGFIDQGCRFMREVIGVDADAVAAYEPGLEFQEVPFGAGGFDDIIGVDAYAVEDKRQFVHQGDVEIALGIFDDLARFGNFDRRCAVGTCFDHEVIGLRDLFKGDGIVSRHHFYDGAKGMFFITGVDAFRRVAETEVAFVQMQVGVFLQKGQTVLFRAAGVGGRFGNDIIATLEDLANGGRGAYEGLEIGYVRFVYRCGNGNNEETGLLQYFGIFREDDVAVLELGVVDLFAGVDGLAHQGDAFGVDIETDDGNLPGELEGDGKAYISQSDHGQFSFFPEKVFVDPGFVHCRCSVCLLASADEFFWLTRPFFGVQRPEILVGLFQSIPAFHFGFPIEDLFGAGDIEPALFGVVNGKGFVNDLLFCAGEGDDLFGELFQRDLGRVADVHRQVVVAEQEAVDAFHEIVDITEGAGLAAIAEDGEVFAAQGLADEGGQGATVVEPHAGSVGIEDTDDAGLEAMEIMIGHGHGFLEPFSFVVNATGADGIHIAPVFLRLRMDQRVAIDLRSRGYEHPGFFRLCQTQAIVCAKRAHLERLNGYLQVVDGAGR